MFPYFLLFSFCFTTVENHKIRNYFNIVISKASISSESSIEVISTCYNKITKEMADYIKSNSNIVLPQKHIIPRKKPKKYHFDTQKYRNHDSEKPFKVLIKLHACKKDKNSFYAIFYVSKYRKLNGTTIYTERVGVDRVFFLYQLKDDEIQIREALELYPSWPD